MKKKFICTVCGYVHEGDEAPEKCPLCGAPKSKFKEMTPEVDLQFVTEHEIGVAKGLDEEMIKDLNAHFMGECTEVGMYLASRSLQALCLGRGRTRIEIRRTAGRLRMGYQDQP